MSKKISSYFSVRLADTSVEKRFLWADIIRVIAIYLVVHFHTAYIGIDKVSVPLFVMLSGALLLGKKESSYVFLHKRILKILIPWIAWTVIYMIFFLFFATNTQEIRIEFFKGNLAQTTVSQWAHYFVRMFFSALWFLPMIFSIYLLTPLLRTIMHNSGKFDIYFMLFAWFCFFSLLPTFYDSPAFPRFMPNLLFTALQYIGYFLVGYLMVVKNVGMNLATITFVVISFIYFFTNTHQWGFLDIPTVLFSITSFILLFNVSNRLEVFIKNKIRKFITLLSRASFGIYLVHQIVLRYLENNLTFYLGQYHLDFLVTVIIFSISALIILSMQKIPVLKYIIP